MGNLSAQEIMNIWAQTEDRSVEEILNAVHDTAILNDSKVLIVSAVGKYTTVQAAVDAAAAAADADNRVLIVAMPGIDRTYIPHPYVDVEFMEDVTHRGRFDGTPWRHLGPDLDPWASPYPGGLLCIIVDDLGSDIFTADAGGCTGTTPAAYCKANGIPLGLAAPVSFIGTTDHLTAAQMRDLAYTYGFEFLSHSWNHAAPPTTHDAVEQEIVASREALESLSDVTLTQASSIGLIVRGFVQPGTWVNDTTRLAVEQAAASGDLTLKSNSTTDINCACPVSVFVTNRTGQTASGAAVTFIVYGKSTASDTDSDTITFSAADLANLANNISKPDYSVLKATTKKFYSVTRISASAGQTTGWKYSAGVAYGDWYLGSVSKFLSDAGRCVRSTYEYSCANMVVGPGQARHARLRLPWPLKLADNTTITTSAHADQAVLDWAIPGVKTVLYFHANPGQVGYTVPADFKLLIDAMVKARTAGKLQVVTPSALFAALPNYSTPAAAYAKLGDFDSWETAIGATPLTGAWNHDWYFYAPTGGSNWYIRADAGSGKCLEMNDAGGRLTAKRYIDFPGGSWCRIRFDAKLASGSGAITLGKIDINENDTLLVNTIDTITLSGTWTTYERCFYIPTWCSGTLQRPQITIATTATGQVVQIDNVRIDRT